MSELVMGHPDVKSYSVTEINKNNIELLKNSKVGLCKIISEANLEKFIPEGFENSFDAVLSVNVFEHVKDDDSIFRNSCKCLKKGGRLILFVPAMHSLFGVVDEADNHYRRYEKSDLLSLAEGNGLSIKRIEYMNIFGALGWFYQGKITKSRVHNNQELSLFNKLVPLLKKTEKILPLPFGLSLIFVGEKQ